MDRHPLLAILIVALASMLLSIPAFYQVLIAEGVSPIEVAVAAIFPACLGVFLAGLLEARRVFPYGVLTLLASLVLNAAHRLDLFSEAPFIYAVAWCCVLMFFAQTLGLWWRGRGTLLSNPPVQRDAASGRAADRQRYVA